MDLFRDDTETEGFAANGFHSRDDFERFADRMGIVADKGTRILDKFCSSIECIEVVREPFFLSDDAKILYSKQVKDRITALRYSHRRRG